MGADKKRKHAKEVGSSVKDMSKKRKIKESESLVEKAAEEKGEESNSKVDKKKKKESGKSKKENNDKKKKKEKKEKKERKADKSESQFASVKGDFNDSNAASSPVASSTDMDMDVDLTATTSTSGQKTAGATVEIMDHDKESKKNKKGKKQVKTSQSIIITTTTVASSSAIATSEAKGGININSGSDDSDKDLANNEGSSKKIMQTSLKVDENGLTKKERKLLKIKQKQLNRKIEGDGEPSFSLKEGHDLTLQELRDLIVFILTETPSLPWIQVLNKFKIDKVVLLYVSGLDPKLFHINTRSSDAHKPIAWAQRADTHGGPAVEFEHLREFFDHANVVKATGDRHRIFSPTNTLLNVPLSNSEKAKREKEKRDQKTGKKMRPENYMMSLEELRENHFPLPRYLDDKALELANDWIETPKLKKTSLTPPPKTMIAIDCEMCRTAVGSELTRVTLINHEGKTILDELVMPQNPILDYLTQYSGMTAAKLEGVTTTLADVQKQLQQIINYNTILVGHSLENDMNVLKLAHPFIIDTSLIYHHTRGPPYRPGLKWLAQKWLNRHIQVNAERGHDSAEDALTCMDLIKLKLNKPAGFGEYVQDQESLFSRLQRFNNPRTSALIDSDAFAGQCATTTIRTTTDEEVVKAIPEAIQNHNFVWARLRDIEINHGKVPEQSLVAGQVADKGRASKISSADKIQATEEEIRAGIRSVDQSMKQIMDALPARTAVIITSGQGDHREVSRMQQRQKTSHELLKKGSAQEISEAERFTEEDERKLTAAVETAKGGICFLTVKR
ncbi:hypothetical protein EDD11_007403 [Mortierella claussenii]|nr:hypothetical protein EDD11_007403 [Mortierella claussenii]